MSRIDPTELHPEFQTETAEPPRSTTDRFIDSLRSFLWPSATFTTVAVIVAFWMAISATLTTAGTVLQSASLMALAVLPFIAMVLSFLFGTLFVISAKFGAGRHVR